MWWFDTNRENSSEVGDYHIISYWGGMPVVVIQTTARAVIPFGLVGAGFAHAEGRGRSVVSTMVRSSSHLLCSRNGL